MIGTGKRTGKTAVAGHWAALLRDAGRRPVILAMGRGGPPDPVLAPAGTGLDDLLAVADGGGHAASDFLEDAALAGVPAVGCRRVGGGLAGVPHESTVAAGVALALEQRPGALVLEGSGACIPPVAADRTVCVVGDRRGALEALGPYRLLRADLALVRASEEDPDLVDEVAAIVPGATCPSSSVPSPSSPSPPAPAWPSSPPARRRRRASTPSSPRPTSPAARPSPPTSPAPAPSAATSTSPSSRPRPSTRSRAARARMEPA